MSLIIIKELMSFINGSKRIQLYHKSGSDCSWVKGSISLISATQMNECFNGVKAHYANKLYHWGASWPGRVGAAVLQVNAPEMGLDPLPDEMIVKIQAQRDERRRLAQYNRSPEQRAKEAARRNQKYNTKQDTSGYRLADDQSPEEMEAILGTGYDPDKIVNLIHKM